MTVVATITMRKICRVLVASIIATGIAGCATTPANTDATGLTDVFGRPVNGGAASWSNDDAVHVPSNAGPNAWSIIITSPSPAQAQAMLEQVRSIGRLPDAFLMERNGKQIIAVGSYQSPSEPAAQAELARVQQIEVEGVQPYAHAFLAPPSGDLSRGTIPEYDLRNARAKYGKDAKYTLQIAVYSKENGKATPEEQEVFHKAAEKAATELRHEGELAFYYHGPNRSMVTVGVFTEQDHYLDHGITVESARLQAVRDKHKYNLLNGRTIIEKLRTSSGGTVDREQPSFLVAIPD